MQEMWVQFLGGEDPLEKDGNPFQYSCSPGQEAQVWSLIRELDPQMPQLKDPTCCQEGWRSWVP